MRETRVFGERSKTRLNDKIKKKYFLVFEGSETEPRYFNTVNNARDILRISPLIELIHLERCRGEEGWSNPKKILQTLSHNLDERDGEVLTYATLLNAMIECLYEDVYIKKRGHIIKEIWDVLKAKCIDDLRVPLDTVVVDKEKSIGILLATINEIRPKISDLILENLSKTLKTMQITYSEEIDNICFIFDRDRKSFTTEQYAYVLQICNERNIKPYISNPCFEFWLLLHFDTVHFLDKTKLLENEKISQSKKANNYATHELKKILGNYSKSGYKSDFFIPYIPTAINNEKCYCESIQDLENQLGSNIGLLLEELLGQ